MALFTASDFKSLAYGALGALVAAACVIGIVRHFQTAHQQAQTQAAARQQQAQYRAVMESLGTTTTTSYALPPPPTPAQQAALRSLGGH